MHGALDFLACGITSAYTFTRSRVSWIFDDPATVRSTVGRVHPPECLTRQFDGAADAGLRVMNAIRFDDEAAPEPEVLAGFADMVAACAERTPEDQHLGASVFGAVQWAASPCTAELEAQAMREHGIGNEAHFLVTQSSTCSAGNSPGMSPPAAREAGMRPALDCAPVARCGSGSDMDT